MIRKLRNAIIRGVAKMVVKTKRFFSKIFSRGFALATAKWALTIGSAAGTIYVLNYFLPVWLTAAIASTVVIHELGHYLTALQVGRKADPPLFVPFIWGVLSGTRIHDRGSVPDKDARIHLAGPTWGFIWSLAGASFSLYFGQTGMAWAFGWLAAFNLWHGTIGSDGQFHKMMYSPEVKQPDFQPAPAPF